ncbi:MAG: response regulator [Chloroflexota bacterium]
MAKILYVEDHPIQREIMTQLLEAQAYNVTTAGNGLEGLTTAHRLHPDLILTDLRKPVMNGFDMISHLRSSEKFRTTPIIVVSAWASHNDKQRAIDAGADAHFSKPPDLKKLLSTIQSYLARKCY